MTGGSPSLRRSRLIVTLTALVNGSAISSQARSSSSSADTTRPCAASSSSSTPNSLGPRSSGCPLRLALRRFGSSRRSPLLSIPLGLHHAQRRARVAAALDSVGLGDRAQHLPGELSGGQQQRVAIARALVKEPRGLLADEPTGNLDEDTRDEIIALLDTLWRERQLTLVLVSHDTSVVRRAQRIGVRSRGRLSIRQDTRA